MGKQARILKDIADTALLRRQADTLRGVVQHPAIEHDPPRLGSGQAADGVNQRGFARAGDAKDGGDPAGGQSFTDLQAVATEGLGKIQLQHHYPPMRWRLTRASHSEISSETSARPMAMRQRRAAAPSPPGV